MNTTSINLEPRWATYVKASAFLLPAALLWIMSVIFVVPKLEQIAHDAGAQHLPSVIQVMIALTRHGMILSAAVAVLLVLLEWRSTHWPRYRRAAVGIGTFLLNGFVLVSIFTMVVAALLYAPALFTAGKRSAATAVETK